MGEIKTKATNNSVEAHINKIEHPVRKADAQTLLTLFKKVTKEKPVLWGEKIIGFGSYHYKSSRSTQEGDWPLTGFSVQKTKLSIYIMPGLKRYPELLEKLGKHKHSVSCLYINKLADVDLTVLEKLLEESLEYMKTEYKYC